jgi:ribose transport system permease protein
MMTANATVGNGRTRAIGDALRRQIQQMLAFASLIVICAFFSLASPFFFSYANFTAILFSTVVIGTLAVGTTFVIVSGGIDLSIGTGMALCAVISGVLLTNMGLPLGIGVLGAVLFGGLIGLVNGFNVAVLDIPPFIATLAMLLVASGLALVLSNSQPIYLNSVPGYVAISTGSMVPQVPNAVLILAVLAIVAGVILRKTLLGRYTYAVGSNEEATAVSGVNVRRWKIVIYAFAGLFTGIAGVLISARLGSAQPATGLGYELEAIAAVIVGGTSLSGGKGTIIGTLIGALIISVINNGLQLMSIPQEWQDVILGCVILLAVYTDRIRKKEA